MSDFRRHGELFWFIGAFAVPAYLASYCLTSKRSAAERALGWMLCSQSLWVLGQILELSATELRLKLYLDGLQYFPMCAAFAWTLAFAHRFAGNPPNRWLITFYCLTAIPAAMFFFLAPLHGLSRLDAEIRPGAPFDTLWYPFTSGDYFLVLGGLAVSSYATLTAALRVFGSRWAYVAPTSPVLLGVALPHLSALPALSFGWTLFGQRDVSFALFGVGGAFILWGLRNGRRVVVPVARDLLFERIPDPAFVIDHYGLILELNSAAAALLNVSHKEDALLIALTELRSEEMDTGALRDAIRSSHPKVLETQSGRSLRVQVHHLRDLDVYLVVLRDVTDEAAAEALRQERQSDLEHLVEVRSRALIATERKFQAIFELSFQTMFLLKSDGRVLDANRAAIDISGADPASVIGAELWTLRSFTQRPELQRQIREAVERAATGKQVRLPLIELAEGEAQIAMDFSLTPIVGPNGLTSMLIGEGRDVTELKRAEEHLRQASKLESMGTLAGGVAHDFNNLLTVILGNISLLRENAAVLDSDAGVLDDVEQAATHAAALSQQLLAFGRKSMLSRKVLDVRTELNTAVRMLGRVIPENIEITLAAEVDVGSITFDSTQLQQIVLNLAINARDAMPDGGKLALTASPTSRSSPEDGTSSDWVRITVSDSGIGMSEETKARIFEPFFTTKELGRGTGLGMAMVYGAVMQHGGSMEVESELGHGTRISLYLRRSSTTLGEPIVSEIREVAPRGVIFLVKIRRPFCAPSQPCCAEQVTL